MNATINAFTNDDVLLAVTVADGASNEQLAGSFILIEDAINSLTCFSHTLELVVKCGLGTVSTSLTRIHSTVLMFKHHTRLRERLAEIMDNKELVDDIFEAIDDE